MLTSKLSPDMHDDAPEASDAPLTRAANVRAVITADQVSQKPPSQLSDEERRKWSELRNSNPALYSPYFHIDYTDLIDSLRDDVSVVIVSGDDGPFAFLPLQGGSFARPVGAPMTDYHGFIKAPQVDFDPVSVLQHTDFGAFHYSALVDDCHDVSTDAASRVAAFHLTHGAQAWRDEQGGSYRRHKKNCNRKRRRTERDAGPVELDFNSRDRAAFDIMIEWKRAQYADTGLYDVLGAGWTLDLLTQLWERPRFTADNQQLNCDMHVLKIDGDYAAIDMGLYDGHTYHSWMVSYNKDLYVYSPGMQLIEDIMDESEALGYGLIDLGVGTEGYKRTYCGLERSVEAGFIAARGPAAALSKLYGAAETLSAQAPLGPLSELPAKLRRRYTQIAACDPTTSGRTKAMLSAVKNMSKR